MKRKSPLRRLLIGFLGLLCAACCLSQTTPSAPTSASPDSSDLIQFINQTITWYRQLEEQRRLATEPSDALVVMDNHRLAQQAIENAFSYARAQADTAAKQATSSTDQ